MSFWDRKEAKRLFQEFPFFNVLIQKPRITCLKNTLCYELSTGKISDA